MFKNNNTCLAVFTGIIGVVFFSAKAVMVKLAYQYDVSPVNLLMFRMLFALPFYIVVLFITRKKSEEHGLGVKDFIWLLFFGFIGYYLASYFDFLGLQYIKASIERVILFIYPTIVVILSALFLKRKVGPVQILAIAITYVGVLVAFWGEFRIEGSEFLTGAGLIFLSALTYASYLTGSDFLIPKFGVLRFTSYAMIIACISVVTHCSLSEEASLSGYHANVYWLGLAMAFLSTVIPSFMVSYSIKEIGASNFSVLGSLGPVSTIILASIFLDEKFTILQMGGTIIVIFGVVVISLQKRRKHT